MGIQLKNTGNGKFNLINLSNSGLIKLRTSSPTSDIILDNLFMKLDASNYSSGQWIDETPNGNNATINGATWSLTNGGIFDFDGLNDTIIVPHNSNLSLSTSIQKTLQVWVKFDTFPTSTNRAIVFSKLSSGFGFDGYFGGPNLNGQPVVATNGTIIARTTVASNSISLNTWYLYTFISQITSTLNTTKIYINDIEFASSQHGADGYSESNNLTFGYMPPPLTGLGGIAYLDGKIGAIYFYTKGLTLSEIITNYNATKSKYGL